jgi:triacylglycerol lipase
VGGRGRDPGVAVGRLEVRVPAVRPARPGYNAIVPRRPIHHLFLVPGFFGFVNFGRLVYFTHVREFLDDAFARLGIPVEIHRVTVSPTASLRTRAAQLVGNLRESAPGDAPIHLIGHSTGGLDARLVVAPGVALGTDGEVEAYAARVRTVVTVVTPHHGTPLASFFASRMGQQTLRVLSIGTAAVLRGARLPAGLLARIAALAARTGVAGGAPTIALLDHLEQELLGRLEGDERNLISRFFEQVTDDQSLIPQLAPEALEIFNAATGVRPGVRYGCVVSRAQPPSLRARVAAGLHPWTQATYALYAWLYARAGGGRHGDAVAEPARQILRHELGRLPTPRDNDGIVPLLSQVWGEVLFVATGDHLDVIGHFDGPRHQPPHHDWLTTGSGFDRVQFEALWTAVARFVAAEGS